MGEHRVTRQLQYFEEMKGGKEETWGQESEFSV